MTPSNPWLIVAKPLPRPRLRMFCLPHAGGAASIFRLWSDSLPEGVEVCGIQLPGREGRWKEAPVPDLLRLIDCILPAMPLDVPFVLYGHSMGSILAFELAREFRRRGLQGPLHLLVSGRRAPHLPLDHPPIAGLSDDQFVAAITRQYNGIPKIIQQDQELLQLFLPMLRADMSVIETYHWQDDDPLDCPLSVFSGIEDRTVAIEQLLAWRALSKGDFRLELLPGDHFFPQTRRNQLLRSIARDLAPFL
jgi:medium-chain acyl-[acyl-carrier-protein] hydrolase